MPIGGSSSDIVPMHRHEQQQTNKQTENIKLDDNTVE
jgi:hypothetical protein